MAEQAAWDFMDSLDKKQKFLLVVLNPTFLFGPTLTGLPFAAGSALAKFMKNGKFIIGVGKFAIPMVDVRDCAHAHYLALTSPNI